MDYLPISNKFTKLFNKEPLVFSAPGRINLIGEHTDYNEGFVLPAAIDKSIIFGINKNDGKVFRFYSIDLDEYFETNDISKEAIGKSWTAYFLGVLAQFKKTGIELEGVDCVFGGNIPLGAGLSSSAALECGFAFGLNELFNLKLPKYDLTIMSQKAEHEYTGVMCGIMDQYASMFGKKNHVLRLDCRTHEHQYFPFEMDDFIIALCDTQVKHELASSEYNLRRQECEKGVSILQRFNPEIKALRDADTKTIENLKSKFDPLIYKRCIYVVKENERVMLATDVLEKKNFKAFGELMYLSHSGLQNEFEVSCKELDLLVDLTKQLDYVYGARMMGGGFGGCTINLVQNKKAVDFQEHITNQYQLLTGITPNIYFVKISDGVARIC